MTTERLDTLITVVSAILLITAINGAVAGWNGFLVAVLVGAAVGGIRS